MNCQPEPSQPEPRLYAPAPKPPGFRELYEDAGGEGAFLPKPPGFRELCVDAGEEGAFLHETRNHEL